jgi:tight adherence protein B
MFTSTGLIYAIYALAAAAGILLVEAVYVSLFVNRKRRAAINHRLKRLADEPSAQEALKLILKERGLSETGDFAYGLIGLNRLYVQSGVRGSPFVFVAIYLLVGAILASVMAIFGFPVLLALAVCLLIGLFLPYLMLRRARGKRIRAFEKQLPDALDMIVRSLRAGHPTPVATALVAREMPDPVGTEFGIAADEVSFGSNLEDAVRKMSERVGSESLRLLAVALSIQAKTGGNLAEILSNLSKVIRERGKLRLKIRALSSEGRVSAIILSVFPLIIFLLLQLVAPSFYGKVWHDPLIVPVFTIFGGLALIGDYIMYRMVTFDF